jgi:hypothetical protein
MEPIFSILVPRDSAVNQRLSASERADRRRGSLCAGLVVVLVVTLALALALPLATSAFGSQVIQALLLS